MAQGKKTDAKTKAKIISAKLLNPDASSRDIEKIVDVNDNTIDRVIREDLPDLAIQSKRITQIVDNDRELLELGTKLTLSNFKQIENGDSLSLQDIKLVNEILDKAKSRVTLFGGDITDEKGGMKEGQFTIDGAGY